MRNPDRIYDQCLWDLRYIDAPVVRWRDGNTDGDLTGGTAEGDNTLYYSNDANMNVTALVDASNSNVVERYVYDPYGKVTIYNSDWSATVAWADSKKNHILYCGYCYDNETRLYQVRHRYYDPPLGRWLPADTPHQARTNTSEREVGTGPQSPSPFAKGTKHM